MEHSFSVHRKVTLYNDTGLGLGLEKSRADENRQTGNRYSLVVRYVLGLGPDAGQRRRNGRGNEQREYDGGTITTTRAAGEKHGRFVRSVNARVRYYSSTIPTTTTTTAARTTAAAARTRAHTTHAHTTDARDSRDKNRRRRHDVDAVRCHARPYATRLVR